MLSRQPHSPRDTSSPTAADDDDGAGDFCQDSTDRFSIGNGRTKNCKWVSTKNTGTRCEKGDAFESCPVTCDAGCTCFDTEGSFTVGVRQRTCEWVGNKARRCNMNFFRSNCPVTCGVC